MTRHDHHTNDPCPEDHGNEPTPWLDIVFTAALFGAPLVVIAVLVVTAR